MAAYDHDIAPELRDKLFKVFREELEKSGIIQKAEDAIEAGKADYKTANDYAQTVGEALAKAFASELSSDQLPDGRLWYNIAERAVKPLIEEGGADVERICEWVQSLLNEKGGLHMKPVAPDPIDDRLKDLLDTVTDAEYYDTKANTLEDGATNLMRHVVDSSVENNAKAQAKAGLHPKILRQTDGNCCEWCNRLAGYYDIDDAPEKIYARHLNCGCQVIYDPGVGKRVNVHSKRSVSDQEFEERKKATAEFVAKYQEQMRREREIREALKSGNGIHAIGDSGNGIQLAFDNFEANVTDRMKAVFNEEFKRAQNMYGPISTIGMVEALSDNVRYDGIYFDHGGRLALKYINKRDAESLMAANAKKKYSKGEWSTKHVWHAMRHEIGHAIQRERYLNDPLWTDKLFKIADIYEKAKTNQDGYSLPSLYSEKSIEEFISECIAAGYVKGHSNTVRDVIGIIRSK